MIESGSRLASDDPIAKGMLDPPPRFYRYSNETLSHGLDSIKGSTNMSRIASLAGLARLLGLAVVIGSTVSGCSSDRMILPERGSTNVVRRPIYNAPEGKAVYLGGYAGASYDPADIPGR